MAKTAIFRTFINTIALGFLVAFHSACHAQTKSASKLTFQGPAEPGDSSIVRDALGRPCLDVEAVARAHVVNPDVLDHVVSVKNNCPRSLKVKVCYFQTDRCNEFQLPGYKRVDTILGTMMKISTFRYSIKQAQ